MSYAPINNSGMESVSSTPTPTPSMFSRVSRPSLKAVFAGVGILALLAGVVYHVSTPSYSAAAYQMRMQSAYMPPMHMSQGYVAPRMASYAMPAHFAAPVVKYAPPAAPMHMAPPVSAMHSVPMMTSPVHGFVPINSCATNPRGVCTGVVTYPKTTVYRQCQAGKATVCQCSGVRVKTPPTVVSQTLLGGFLCRCEFETSDPGNSYWMMRLTCQ